jgi:hypothetical protein
MMHPPLGCAGRQMIRHPWQGRPEMDFIGAEHKPAAGYFAPIALVTLAAVLAACTANQPPAPTPPAAYYQPPPPPPPRPHHRAVARPKGNVAAPTPGEAAANPAPGEPVALLSAPAEATGGMPGAGLGDMQEALQIPATSELVGLDEQRAIELFGPATTAENRAPATVWHSKSSRCELDLVFYMEMRSGKMRTLHYDFKTGAQTPQQRQACLKTIMQENSRNSANSN